MLNLTRHRQADADDMYFPASSAEVMRVLRSLGPDIVHVHMGGSLFLKHAALFLFLSTLRGTRSVFTFHSGGFPESPEGLAARPASVRGFALRQLDAVIGVNRKLVETFARYGVRRERLHLIEPHANLDAQAVRGTPLREDIAEFAAAHDPLLVTVGLLEPEYGLDVQLAALPAIRAAHPRAGLLIIGSGSLHAELRAAIDAHPHRDDILLCGDVQRPVTLATIARATVLLRTTHYDGDAISVREALALGTPVLATDNGMRPDGVRLLPSLDAGALAAHVTRTLSEQAVPASPGLAPSADPMPRILDLYRQLFVS